MFPLLSPLAKKYLPIVGIAIAFCLLLFVNKEQVFGSGYRPVTNYDARITSFTTAAATSFNVNSTKDKVGHEIILADISPSSTPYAYFTVEPGITGQEELIACAGKSTGVWSSCLRGLSYQGGSMTASTTLAHAHNAGSRIIMSDIGQFFGEYLSKTGDEIKYGVLTFDTFPRTSSTTAVPGNAYELANKYYVDSVGAGGITANNVSTTLGLQAISSGVPNCPSAAACIGINASTTASLNGGFLNFTAVTGKLYWDIVSFLAGSWTWAGTNIFATARVTNLSATSTSLTLPYTPTSTLDAANKGYVDTSLNTVTSSLAFVDKILVSATSTVLVNTTNETLLFAVTSTNVLSGTNGIRSKTYLSSCSNSGGGGNFTFRLKYGSATVASQVLWLNGVTMLGTLETWLLATTSTASQRAYLDLSMTASTGTANTGINDLRGVSNGLSGVDSTVAQQYWLTLQAAVTNPSVTCTVDGTVIELLR